MLYVCMHVQMCLYVLAEYVLSMTVCVVGWWLLPANTCSLTGNPRVPVTRSGTGMGINLYPSAGMGFLTGVFFLRGHGYGLVLPSGYVPVAILNYDLPCSVAHLPKYIPDEIAERDGTMLRIEMGRNLPKDVDPMGCVSGPAGWHSPSQRLKKISVQCVLFFLPRTTCESTRSYT
jgi:hypothetical protein